MTPTTGPQPGPDLTAVRQLTDDYAAAVDARDGHALAALLAPDFELVVPGSLQPDGVSRTLTSAAEVIAGVAPFLRTRHHVDRVEITVNGDRATGEVLGQAHHLRRQRDGTVLDHHVHLRYHDTLVRRDGLWLFARRRLEVEWYTEVAAHLSADAGPGTGDRR